MGYRNSSVKYIVITLILGIAVCAGIVVYGINKKGKSITYDRSKMLEYAHRFHDQGELSKAIQQLEHYCVGQEDVFDEELELAKWHEEAGDAENALKAYAAAVGMAEYKDNEITVKEPFYHISTDDLSFSVEPVVGMTKNMELLFKGEDITPEGYEKGKVNGIRNELTEDEGCRTTPWTDVDKSKGTLIVTGDMNCAIWQFMNADEEIINIEDLYTESDEEEADEEETGSDDSEEGENVISNYGSIEIKNRPYSIINIPEDAVKCRVTYADESIGERTFSDNKGIVMFYGKNLQGYSDSGSNSCALPDLAEGQSITYRNGKWSLCQDGKETEELDIDTPAIYNGAGIFMQGEICGKVVVETGNGDSKTGKDAEYGIEFANARGHVVGRRLGDAVGMHFDYIIGDQWAGDGVNDFDGAYPWSDMRLCNLTYDENYQMNVVYESDAGFATDGSNGNVMVEIPKFYVKRYSDNDIEQIWISGTQHSGYVIDPVFMDGGEEKDYVYVAAYLGVKEEDKLLSKAGKYPVVNETYETIRALARDNGEGFREIGFTMYSAIQKLFLVETGCLDSSSVMSGETDLYYYSKAKDYNNKNTGIAIQSMPSSNRIVVNNFDATQKLEAGSSVIFLTASEGWESMIPSGGPNGTDEPPLKERRRRSYEEEEEVNLIPGGCCREITDVTADDDHIEITFDGEPIDIRAGETVIASYPSLTGKTGTIEYCTGCLDSNDGRHGFKYRNIENIYGSEMVMLGADAYLLDGVFVFTDENGEEISLNAFVPEQNMGVDGGVSDMNNTNDICIRMMSYDSEHPTIMVPVESGASCYNNYCDHYYYKRAVEKTPYYLCMGDPMNVKRAGGLFDLRAIIDSEEWSAYYCGGRLMYR